MLMSMHWGEHEKKREEQAVSVPAHDDESRGGEWMEACYILYGLSFQDVPTYKMSQLTRRPDLQDVLQDVLFCSEVLSRSRLELVLVLPSSGAREGAT
jgi:hypothetical protein